MSKLPPPFTIGNHCIETPLTLAPMAGHSNYAFRTLCRAVGDCGLVCTEVVSSNVIYYNGVQYALKTFDWQPEEAPLAVQLFGAEAHVVAEAARVVVEHGAQIVDINMGCWVPKVAKKGGGAALLRDICTAQAVVEAVVKAVNVPVTVKVRSGWEAGDNTAVPFAKIAEQAGAQAIAVHGRYAKQGFRGDADWDVIRQVKETVSIPVIGNGDVKTPEDAERMLKLTGCDGLMIGRGALGTPWIFKHIAHYLRTGEKLPRPNRAERAALALEHARRTFGFTYLPEWVAAMELRGQLMPYGLDADGESVVRDALIKAQSQAEIEAILLPLCEGNTLVSASASLSQLHQEAVL